jgi:2-dehydro-3-deoxyphosphogluconate aldolase/(4S)-4-hydroxy-2-oxoglutarate aldolase
MVINICQKINIIFMDKKQLTLDQLIQQGILPLFFHPDPEVSLQVMRALYRAGIRMVEYTNRGKNSVDNFLRMRKITDQELPGLQLGAGTIRNKIEATEFINEGADFLVSPGLSTSVADLADKNNLLWIPGCFTASEIMQADDLGARLIKLFPGNLLGHSFISSLKEIFPNLLFMPTGGVEANKENLQNWFTSGASVVGMGSKLISKSLLDAKDYAGIEVLARQTIQFIRQIRN